MSEVEVDGFTGQYRMLRTDILQDVGDSISPLVDRGQIEGGFLQGLGWLTIEELLWDATGRVSSGGASTYKLPSWSEVPEISQRRYAGACDPARCRHGQQGCGRAAADARDFGPRGHSRCRRRVRIGPDRFLRQSVDARAGVLRCTASTLRAYCPQMSRLRDSVASASARGASADKSAGQDLFRATIFHTPANPFPLDIGDPQSLRLSRRRRACWCAEAASSRAETTTSIRGANSGATTIDWRGGFLVPGFIDAHVHFPQLRIIGAMGRTLLDWLEHVALPEEARMADARYAADTARQFLRALASHGTTTALVFGAHFSSATAQLFEEAAASGLRIVSGLVVSDRLLQPIFISLRSRRTRRAGCSSSGITDAGVCCTRLHRGSRCRHRKRCSRCAGSSWLSTTT